MTGPDARCSEEDAALILGIHPRALADIGRTLAVQVATSELVAVTACDPERAHRIAYTLGPAATSHLVRLLATTGASLDQLADTLHPTNGATPA